MPPPAKRRAETQLRRRKPKRQATPNGRWMQLSSAETDLLYYIHVALATISTFVVAMTQLLALVLAAEGIANEGDIDQQDVISVAIDTISIILMGWLGILHAFREVNGILFDIPPEEEAAPIQFSRAKGLRIDDLSDMAALKMTRFNWSQLRRLYAAFDLQGQLEPLSTKLAIPTGHVFNGSLCCYRIHPEEIFLFTLCRLASGMTQVQIVDGYFGGDKNRWSYAYPWMLKYLDERYSNIIGHQGLARYLDDFPRFKRAIKEYVQRDHQRELVDGTMTIVPGINFLPWDVFAFIDDSIDQVSTPFSGPRGDYEGAARKAEFADAQQAFYSGYSKNHGIKIETIFLPNGLTTLFGPVSARRADAGVLAMSNLNAFLVELQRGKFSTLTGAEVFFCAFGDSAYNLGLQCIQSYYQEFRQARPMMPELDAMRRCEQQELLSRKIMAW